ncbi:MAG TPA: permease-like cell division protein FtsX [Candidatus Acidoferrum sp.]|nr:permease-like cell division protein FtsX [Candidatus Acidoferrum sp.]
MIGNVGYFISQGCKYFWSNKYVSMAAVGVLAACLFIMGNFWLVYQNVDVNLKLLQDENETVLFLNENLTDDEITGIGKRITAIVNVDKCEFVTKEQAFEDYKEAYSDERDLYADIEEQGVNPLRDYYVVTMKDLELYDETIYQLQQIDGVYRVRMRKDIIDGMQQVAKAIYFVCYWIMGLLFAASLFIIVNTIKIARFVNRRQINIMKFVGATDWFVRWPFIFEGAIIGLTAAAIGFAVEWYAYTYVMEKLATAIKAITIITFQQAFLPLLAAFIVCGLVVGVLGSGISIRKYLDI